MRREEKEQIYQYIKDTDPNGDLVSTISPNDDFSGGSVTYNETAVKLHRKISSLTAEEYVRAFLLVHLVKDLGYRPSPEILEMERSYSIGRPGKGAKGGRVDLIVRYPNDWSDASKRGSTFLFIECKEPEEYDADRKYLEGQLFNLAKQEMPTPELGVYYTSQSADGKVLDRAAIVDLTKYQAFSDWDSAGQPTTDVLPRRYGTPARIEFANIDEPSQTKRPLRTDVRRTEFERIRSDLHNIVWGGGGTNNNDVFVTLVRAFLCRVYDENETASGSAYRFQRIAHPDGSLETPEQLVERLTALFREAAQNYLGYSDQEIAETIPFERKKVSASKIAFVVEQIQGLSLTHNTSKNEGDLLGDFFEGIVSQDFTQTKGQFFTHINLVKFCLLMANFEDFICSVFLNERDEQGRPKLPYIIDPSAGSGTFLVEAMKLGTSALVPLLDTGLTNRQREFAQVSFGPSSPNQWAREYIYGIEPNADLGLAAKVNMILHGDGSTNIFVKSGLLPFSDYRSGVRNHVLGSEIQDGNSTYDKPINASFDFIFSNPPFSVSISEEEKSTLEDTFSLANIKQSESIFLERWFQLLRDGGLVVTVLPESVLDTSTALSTRLFLYKHFEIDAIVSLPYIAFKPFTSTKTCIIVAKKRSEEDLRFWEELWSEREEEFDSSVKKLSSDVDEQREEGSRVVLGQSFQEDAPLNDEIDRAKSLIKDKQRWLFNEVAGNDRFAKQIFLAEPLEVGYKRRKGLDDLLRPNDLYSDDEEADSVLKRFLSGATDNGDARYGFWVSLKDFGKRGGLRCDPKYHSLWTLREGKVFPEVSGNSKKLGELIKRAKRDKVSKGALDTPTGLIELEDVEARNSTILNVSEVDEVGSDKVVFGDCDLAISKLEPYLGKVLKNNPTQGWIGSTEWLSYDAEADIDVDFLRYLLLLPQMLEAYRCLQSGKRHARFNEADFLDLLVPNFDANDATRIAEAVRGLERQISELKQAASNARSEIDATYLSGGEVSTSND